MPFTEKSAVEDYIIEKLKERGWEFRKADELERESYQEPLLEKDLVRAIKRINDFDFTESDVNKILIELKHRDSGVQGVKEILRFLKYGIAIKFEKTRELRYVKLIDYEDVDKNEFVITRQATYRSTTEEIRPDIILYVNGIPLVIFECKNPADPTVSWKDAFNQIQKYERDVPELFKYIQFSVAAEEDVKYFPNVPRTEDVHIYTWKAEEFDVLDASLEMFSRETLLDFIRNFIFIREERGRTTKVMARYMQYHAANKIYERVIDNLEGKEEKKSGLIWHWQGSGKTLTMIFAANKLYRKDLLENPTIFFILDRIELEDQIRDEFSALDLGIEPDIVSSIKELKEILLHDEGRGKRGIIITLIHKFGREELPQLEKELRYIKEKENTILSRKNVIAFVDEGHRTQYGILAAQMRSILENSFFFAFTGTPIAKTGRDTFITFSPPEEKYLDKYFILDSIKDGFTIPIRFQSRLEKEVHLEKNYLEQFLGQKLEEVPEEFQKDVEEKTKRRLTTIRVVMKNPRRIEMIAKDIAKHFLENVDDKFKAMVVAVDRESCVMYKKALDELLPPEYSEIVMTFGIDDRREIFEYFEKLKDRYHGKEKEDRTGFKEEDYPKILIVTDMLLTGFDAPILQVMYLDKPLKEHRLLQAIARTNRPYKGVKEAGLILDYVGIFREFEKAVAIYSKDDILGVAYDLEEERKEFISLLNQIKQLFRGIDTKRDDRETLMKAIKRINESKDNTKRFEGIFRKLRKIFELLGPDPIKSKYLKEFKWISAVYHVYIRHVKRDEPDETERYVEKYFKKTLDYIHKTIKIDELNKEFPILSLDEKYIEKLKETYPDLDSRISDMVFTLNKYILVDRTRNPIYESVADRVERILKSWRERKKTNQEIYEELENVIQEFNESGERQRKLGLTNLEYYTLIVLERILGKDERLTDDARRIIQDISPKMFKDWTLKKSVEKDIGRIIRKKIRKYKISIDKRDEIYDKIMETLKKSDQ
ncbi:MAG: type I restriction endonuclease subunit R [Candidatus Methanofastidiosia archaeon]